jgi:putative (di)nucleoside polyphosphate hydrolase
VSKRLPYAERPYRKGVGMVLFNGDGLVFVARRIDTTAEAWQLPQGGIDDGESPRDACLRELEEEIGTDKAEIIAETDDWLAYDLPEDIADKVWKGRFRGQEQKWYGLRFLGDDGDIDLDTDHPEFCEWKWLPVAELPDMIVPFKRALYERIVDCFADLSRTVAAGDAP